MPTVPLASVDGVEMVGGGRPIVIVKDAVTLVPCASVTLTDTGNVPWLSGVPRISPVCELSTSPAGNPVADHVYPPDPPVAASLVKYVVPDVPGGRLPVMIARVEKANVIRKALGDARAQPVGNSDANGKEPGVFCVPVILPLCGSSANPEGNPEADHV